MLQYDNLLGQLFDFSKKDCFSLVQDVYEQNYGIKLTNYARPKDWDADTNDIIGLTYSREGFYKVPDWTLASLQPGDLLAMAIGSSKANHLAVYVGENTIVHHVTYLLSREEVLRDFWRKSTCYVLRHKDVKVDTVEKPSVTIEELIYARNQLPVEAPTS